MSNNTAPLSTDLSVYDIQLAQQHPQMLAAVTRRAMEFADSSVRVMPAARKQNGWLEWSMLVRYNSGSELFIGAIQRRPEAEIEFCS